MSHHERVRQRDIRMAAGSVILIVIAVLVAQVRAGGGQPMTPSLEGRVVRFDPRFDRLVPQGAGLEKVATGFAEPEGAVWDRWHGSLLFSDVPRNSVFEWREGAPVRLFMKPSGYTGVAPFPGRQPGANGLAFDSEGRLVLAEHGDRRIARLDPDGHKVTIVDRYRGRRLNSPNDLVVASNGDVYFTDPSLGLLKTLDDPQKELAWSGVYRVTRAGDVALLTTDLPAPAGIALAPSERTLYVSNADRRHAVWMAYDVQADGTLANGRTFFDATAWTKTKKGVPGGIKVDAEGNLFVVGPGGVHVLAPDGTYLGSIELDAPASNLAWGTDGSVLYVTAGTALYRIRLDTKGAGSFMSVPPSIG